MKHTITVHVCPACGRWHDSPSIHLGADGHRTITVPTVVTVDAGRGWRCKLPDGHTGNCPLYPVGLRRLLVWWYLRRLR